MPRTNAGFSNVKGGPTGAQLLIALGPTLPVEVGFDPQYDPSNRQKPAGTPQVVHALVDTGATGSHVDDELAKGLALPLVDRRTVSPAVGGRREVNVYLAQVHIPSLGLTEYGRLTGADLKMSGQQHQVILGRSLLKGVVMIYDGVTGQVTLTI